MVLLHKLKIVEEKHRLICIIYHIIGLSYLILQTSVCWGQVCALSATNVCKISRLCEATTLRFQKIRIPILQVWLIFRCSFSQSRRIFVTWSISKVEKTARGKVYLHKRRGKVERGCVDIFHKKPTSKYLCKSLAERSTSRSDLTLRSKWPKSQLECSVLYWNVIDMK